MISPARGHRYDAVVVGSGPNGLAAAIVLARAGWHVLIREGASVIGGGVRSAELTLPGYLHDVCSAVYPLGAASPLFRSLPLAEHGLRWIEAPVALAHPLDDGPPALLCRSLAATGATLGSDGERYDRLLRPFATDWEQLLTDILRPLLHWPEHPVLLARFGLRAIRSVDRLVRSEFSGLRAQALLAGLAAHAGLPLTSAGSASFGLVLAILGHAVGWPVPEGGAQALADALVSYFRSLGGEIECGAPVTLLDELPSARATLLDVTPAQFLRLAGDRLSHAEQSAMQRYRYGPGVFKLDWALSEPVPWRSPECREAMVLHLGGSLSELTVSEAAPWHGAHAERPYVLMAQPSLFDPSRAPADRHTLWAYCHVPNGSTVDMTSAMERQIERFAPGFGDVVLKRSALGPGALEARDPNLVGGDISGGANMLRQIVFRPRPSLNPYGTSIEGVFLCSASTPPGGAVHGMCGFHAAEAVLRVSRDHTRSS
ncbi:MAG: phytoene desaturase family protein [Gemmatimonadaceae bacterium]